MNSSDKLLDRIENKIGVLDLWDYSHQNGRKIHGVDMKRNYDERVVYYDSWAKEIMQLRGSNQNVMLLNYFSNVILHALTSLIKSDGRKKCVILPMTHFFPKSQGTDVRRATDPSFMGSRGSRRVTRPIFSDIKKLFVSQ
eukprot:scaffold249314_cov54-Cyclotella_meneghiniana.AAC.3